MPERTPYEPGAVEPKGGGSVKIVLVIIGLLLVLAVGYMLS